MLDEPVLSILTLGGDAGALERTYESLAGQDDARWQWCVVADPGAGGVPFADPRVVTTGVAGTGTPHDLDRAFALAHGRHVMVLTAGDLLSPGTVAVVAGIDPASWAYTDEEQRFPGHREPDVWAKPAYSPELLRSQPYAVRSAVLPRALLGDIGGIRDSAGTAAWYDAVLRISEAAGPAVHVPAPHVVCLATRLRERFSAGAPDDVLRVVAEHCARTGIDVAEVRPVVVQGRPVGQRLHRRLDRRPSISLVIPTRGGTSVVCGRARRHVTELISTLWVDGRYPDLEVVVVYDADTPQEVLDELRATVGDDLVLCRYDGWFDFSRKCNLGALAARGEYLCFLNDDMAAISADWLEVMAAHLADPGVGGVGTRLLFPDGTLQHIGHRYDDGAAGHPLFGWRANTLALGAAAHVAGERSGVTAACLLVRAADFERLGGFSQVFPLNYNDVDFCLKLREEGFRIVYTPHAELIHFESQSRVPVILPSERASLSRRWAYRMAHDAYLRQPGPVAPRSRFLPAPHLSEETHD